MKGKYYCELYDGKRRRSLCLQTTDLQEATERYGAGMHELRLRIRSEAEAKKKQQEAIRPQWLPEQLRADKQHYQSGNVFEPIDGLEQEQDLPGDSLLKWKTSTIGADELAAHTTKDPLRREQLASYVAGQRDKLPLTWEELVENSVTVRKRKHGKDYSESWHKNVRQTIERIPFGPEEVTPVKIREFMDLLETKYDQRGATIKNRLSALQGLFTNAIKSGYRPDLAPNPFDMVDFSVAKAVETKAHYYCPTEADYRKLFTEILPNQPERVAVGIELMAFTGCRVSGVPYLKLTSTPGWIEIPDIDGTKGGGRVPVPMDLWKRGRDLRISVRKLNGVLKEVHPELCNHGLRSGFKRLTRAAGVDSQLSENLMMHKLQGLEAVYGGNCFPDEAMQRGAEATWDKLREIIGAA